ncbi:alpha/beta hydrolase family protein [Flavilitoribacter nigricans]|uniref:Peptidase S9 family protein n=1 Tax=Flavilitoribacter nigricans (strain ATCC 23147 / DSM 23189 / NBRC 102662 / NCIMB 1420 / SS-2) TaxID=1122177 RepID=A0A2D0N3B8_FLAN2|nr:S9 family peptidase [Flavilitoribacter nigricans]PHN02253.1 peptidase S9 family protein [Flavilitoribacter nigricans DSM 23189 = NBRC 102662]
MTFRTLLLLLLTGAGLSLAAQSKPVFSGMDVFDLEWADQPQISPDGQMIVYQRRSMDIMNDRRQTRLWLINTLGNDHQKLTDMDVNEGNATWSPDGRRIAFTASTEQGTELFIYWLGSGKSARISQLPASPGGLSWSPDGEWIAFSMFVSGSELSLVPAPKKPAGAQWADPPRITTRLKHEADGSGYMSPGFHHLFVIPAEGGSARQITHGDRNHRGQAVWTKDGQSLLLSANLNEDWEYDFRNSEIYRIDLATGDATALTDRKGPDSDPVLSPNGRQIAYLGNEDKVQTYQINELTIMNLDGSNKKTIDLSLDRRISDIRWSPEGDGLYFMYTDKGNSRIAFTDLQGKTQMVVERVSGTSVARPYSSGAYSLAGNGAIAYTHSTPYRPADLAVVKKRDWPKIITKLNEEILGARELGRVEEIWYQSSVDGIDIQGWIVYPPGFDENGKYPLLVENHGGPISNYDDSFSPEMQLYAAAGYVVFYPNPRGSTGYGENFGNLLYHNYPGDDYQDVMDGVDAMIGKGFIAEDQLFVTGGSAGGIMTAWMIGKNDRFRAAAVVKPVMNWISKTLTADNYYGYAYSRYPGQPWENPEIYMKFSPVSLVGNIQTPTLVMVGTSDLRTPLSEAKQLYHALKLRKIETALVEVPGAYHFISNRPSQLITKVEHILAWFARYRD